MKTPEDDLFYQEATGWTFVGIFEKFSSSSTDCEHEKCLNLLCLTMTFIYLIRHACAFFQGKLKLYCSTFGTEKHDMVETSHMQLN